MPAPLTNPQKRHLSQLARRAWAQAGPELDGMTPEDFRRNEVATACGKHGLRCCNQDDYKIVEAHFLNLLGETGQAMNALVRAQSNPRRVAEYKLLEACEHSGVNLAYAAAICQRIFKCALDDADAQTIWKVCFTIKNRARKVTFQQ